MGSVAPGYCQTPARKLGRGVWNVLTFPGEIFNRIKTRCEDAGPIEGVTTGLFEGIGMSVFRLAMGIVETVFFVVPLPEKYEPIIKDPEFLFLDDVGKKQPKDA
jgi:putative exosortase-associated protein (TIGR04073 family)